MVQTPPDTREEERERRREANKDDHTMERLEDTVCVCVRIYRTYQCCFHADKSIDV